MSIDLSLRLVPVLLAGFMLPATPLPPLRPQPTLDDALQPSPGRRASWHRRPALSAAVAHEQRRAVRRASFRQQSGVKAKTAVPEESRYREGLLRLTPNADHVRRLSSAQP